MVGLIDAPCVLVLDGRKAPAACSIDIPEDSQKRHPIGFITADLELLKLAQLARRVQAELKDGGMIEIVLLQVHSTGIALVSLCRDVS